MNTNHHPIDDDQQREARLTAYALGQLDEQERAAVEAELAASEKAREEVRTTRVLANYVYEATCRDQSLRPSPGLRLAVEERLRQLEVAAEGGPSASPPAKPLGRSHRRLWGLLALAACLLVAAVPSYMFLTGLGRFGDRRELARRELARRELASPLSEAQAAPEAAPEFATGEPEARRERAAGDASGRLSARDMASSEGRASELSAVLQPPGQPAGRAAAMASEPASALRPGLTAPRENSKYDSSSMPGLSPGGGYGARSSAGVGSYGSGSGAMPGYPGREGGGMSGMGGMGPGPGAMPAEGKPGLEMKEMKPKADGVFRPTVRPDRGRSSPASEAAAPQAGPAWRDASQQQTRFQAGVPTGQIVVPTPSKTPMLMPGPGGYKLGGPAADKKFDGETEELLGGVAPPGTEEYQQIAENPFRSATDHPLSTFSIDVDTASYANVRRFLRQGTLPPRDAVRIEEMLNYFPYRDPPPKAGEPFSVSLEAAQCPWNNEHRLVRIGLAGRQIERGQRGPSNLVFLLDVSGSMDEPDKLPLVKEAMKMLVRELTEDDRVAIVTYAETTGVRLESTNAGNKAKILDSIDSLTAGGRTNGGAGIQLAYEEALKHFRRDGTNRVILATDGDLNVGITQDDELVRLIRDKKESGVLLTVLGVGTGNLKDSKLEKLADKGNGSYAYLDSVREARRVLVEQIAGSLVTIAKDVKIQVEFNPAEVASYRLIGYENRRLAARDFDDDRKDAGEIGAGHHVTALYEIVSARAAPTRAAEEQPLRYQRPAKSELTDDARSGQLLTLQLRYKRPNEDQSNLLEFALRDAGKRFGEASADFQFAAAVASFGMILRGSPYRGQATLKGVEEIAASALRDDPGGHRAEFLDLVRGAEQLRGHE